MTGEWPPHDADHHNRNRSDDRWDNIRKATRAENLWNASLQSRNISGYKGVSWSSERKKWVAMIAANGKQKNLGRFQTIEEAIDARRKAAEQLHGEFATDGTHVADRLPNGDG